MRQRHAAARENAAYEAFTAFDPAVEAPPDVVSVEVAPCALAPADAASVEVAPFAVALAFEPDVAPAVSFTDERSMLPPSHFDWITLMTPFEFRELTALAMAVFKSELLSSTPTQ